MAEPHVISQLKDKRRRLHGQLLDTQKQYLKLKADLAAVDHTLKVMGYQDRPCDLPPIKPIKNMFANKEIVRLVADIISERPDLPTDTLIAIEIISRKNWDSHDTALHTYVKGNVKRVRLKYLSDLLA